MNIRYLLLNTDSTITTINCQLMNDELTIIGSEIIQKPDSETLRKIAHEQSQKSEINLYCCRCSGICLPKKKLENGVLQCFHCQIKYSINPILTKLVGKSPTPSKKNGGASVGHMSPSVLAPQLPSTVINYLRQNNLVEFQQSDLMKTLKKEKYRSLYNYYLRIQKAGKGSSTQIPSSMAGLMTQFEQILNKQEFTNELLESLQSQYGKTLPFLMDTYHLL